MRYIALHYCSKFQKNLTAFGGVMARKPSRSSLQWQFLLLRKHLKIHNLATTNAILMKLTTIMYLHETFHLAKNWGVTHRVQEAVNEKPLKKSQKTSFLAQFLGIFRTISKTVIYVTRYIAPHYFFKFQKNLTAFGGVMARKPPRSSLQWQFLLLRKQLKIHNLATTNSILMKLTTIMYFHKTFNLAEDWVLNDKAQVSVS